MPRRFLFGEAIGVDAGQRFHERGFAVIDVSCGADDAFLAGHADDVSYRVAEPRAKVGNVS